ncbi:MAG: glycosyltransferase family 2 protein [Pseudomonadota bacterium]
MEPRPELLAGPVPSPPDLELLLVIPALAEPALDQTLNSIAACDPPSSAVGVVVLVNSAENASEAVREQNQQSMHMVRGRTGDPFPVWLLAAEGLPGRHAGVGLARKLGLDFALARLLESRSGTGVLVNLDADCLVDSDYLTAIEAYFEARPKACGAGIYYEHELLTAPEPEHIAAYELHLRYYLHALRSAGIAGSFHTVGSCIALRAEDYMAQGGMNRRQAGEDYYLVQKLAATGRYGEINTTRVRPSARVSRRVPFGTGRAMAEATGPRTTYPLAAFDDLAVLTAGFHDPQRAAQIEHLAPPLQAFLTQVDYAGRLADTAANTASDGAFQRRLARWFNGFLAMKYLHQVSDVDYPRSDVVDAARRLQQRLDPSAAGTSELTALLSWYRQRCRSGVSSPDTDAA